MENKDVVDKDDGCQDEDEDDHVDDNDSVLLSCKPVGLLTVGGQSSCVNRNISSLNKFLHQYFGRTQWKNDNKAALLIGKDYQLLPAGDNDCCFRLFVGDYLEQFRSVLLRR